MTLYLLQDCEDEYEADFGEIGIYSTYEKALEAAAKDAENRNRRIEGQTIHRQENRSMLPIQKHYLAWSEDIGEWVWDGQSWTSWGHYFITEYELDAMPEKAIEE